MWFSCDTYFWLRWRKVTRTKFKFSANLCSVRLVLFFFLVFLGVFLCLFVTEDHRTNIAPLLYFCIFVYIVYYVYISIFIMHQITQKIADSFYTLGLSMSIEQPEKWAYFVNKCVTTKWIGAIFYGTYLYFMRMTYKYLTNIFGYEQWLGSALLN